MQTEATLAQSDVSELDLVKRCQDGDTEAFDELVTRYRTRVFGMIYNMVHSEQDAWDLAQESFLKAWKSIGRFRGQSSFYTWIYRIVMNVTIDWMRKKKIKGGDAEFDDAIQLREIDPASKTVPKTEALPHQAMEREEIRARIEKAIAQLSPEHRAVILMKEIDDMQYHEIAEALPHQAMERDEIRTRIEKAIGQLSPEHRAVILMKEIDDMQYHEIAETLGCSIGTVMSRLFYARKKLQNLLRDVYENV